MNNISKQQASVTWLQLLTLIGLTVSFTFTITSIYKDVQKDVEYTEYVNSASRRRDANLKKELEYKHDIMILQVDIKNLKQDLKEAEEDIIEWREKYLELKSDIKK